MATYLVTSGFVGKDGNNCAVGDTVELSDKEAVEQIRLGRVVPSEPAPVARKAAAPESESQDPKPQRTR